jgi:hypothetical protein
MTVRLRLLLTSLTLIGLFAVAVTAQDRTDEPVAVRQIIDTGDSPLQVIRAFPYNGGGTIVTSGEMKKGDRVGYVVHNSSNKPVLAYSLVETAGEGDTTVRMAVYSGLVVRPGEDFQIAYIHGSREVSSWTFDWILFGDGSTWGPDEYGRSKEIVGYIAGRNAAIKHVSEEVEDPDTHPLPRMFRDPAITSWSLQLPLAETDARTDNGYFRKGYDEVLTILRHDAEVKKNELSRRIAERLSELEDKEPARP